MSRSEVMTPSDIRPSGRVTTTRRAPEVGGGRMPGGAEGGVTHNYNTYNVNNGTNYGSIGNAGGSISVGSGGGQPGTRSGGGRAPREAHGTHPDIWVRDVNGAHSLREGIEHVTGRSGGHGEHLAMGKTSTGGKPGTGYGAPQRPMSGSSRTPAGTAQSTGWNTGTTHDWQGPQGGVTMPKSGVGSAAHTGHSPAGQLDWNED
jgi:hypothetical protein